MDQENKVKYIPIACQYYDVIELNASRKKEVELAWLDWNEKVITKKDVIKDILTRDKEEFLILSDQTEVRLDRIISIDDTQFYGSCGF